MTASIVSLAALYLAAGLIISELIKHSEPKALRWTWRKRAKALLLWPVTFWLFP